MKRAALAYAASGLKVFPLHGISSTGRCTCGNAKCMSPGKHPRLLDGYLGATDDVAQVADWWSDWPESNIGLPCGPNNFVAIDVDPRHGGDKTLADLVAQHGPIVSTMAADTGGGGQHICFEAPASTVELPGKLGPGIDLKRQGYVVAAPSLHASGCRYGWQPGKAPEADPTLGILGLSPLPAWVPRGPAKAEQKATTSEAAPIGFPELCIMLAHVPNGEDHEAADSRDYWLRIGGGIHHATGGSGEGLEAFDAWSRRHPSYDAEHTARTWRSFGKVRSGAPVTWRTLAKIATANGWKPAPTDTSVFGAVEDGDEPKGDAAPAVETEIPDPKPKDPKPEKIKPAFRFETAADLEAEADEPSEWLVDDLVEASTMLMISGPPGAGKSALTLDLLLRIAHGLPWSGRPTKQTGVLLMSPEGPRGFKRRFKAWHAHAREHGHVVGNAPFEVLRAQIDLFGNDVGLNALGAQIASFQERHGVACGIVVVDTLRQAMIGGDENNARDIGTFLAKLTRLRDKHGVAAGIVHHTGKDESRGASGSTALVGGVDVALSVSKPQGSKAGKIKADKLRDGVLDAPLRYELTSNVGEVRSDGTVKRAVVAVVGAKDATLSLGAVDDDQIEAAELPVPVEPTDDAPNPEEIARRDLVLTIVGALAAETTDGKVRSADILTKFNARRRMGKKHELSRAALQIIIADLIETGALHRSGVGPKCRINLPDEAAGAS